MVCKECGAGLMDTDQFCPKCGTRVIKEKRCPECGVVLREGTKFCHKCGRLVEGGNGQRAEEKMEDIPIAAIEQNILSETAAEIKAGRSVDREPRRTTPAEGRPERSTASSRSKTEHAPAPKSAAPKKTADHTAASRSASPKSAPERTAPSKSAPSKSASGRSTSAKSAQGHSPASGKAAPGKRPAPPPSGRRSSVPEPPRRKRIDYREDDWEDEDWEDDEDWDEDDEEGIDFITIMTVVVGCVLLIVVAFLGYRLYRQHAPRDYEKEAEVQEDDTAVDEDDGEEEKPQEMDETGETGETGETDETGDQSIADGNGNGTYQIIVTGREVNVRNQPSTSGTEILGKVREGDVLPCYGTTEDGQWYEIRLENGTSGYVFYEYVEIISSDVKESASSDVEYIEEQLIQE